MGIHNRLIEHCIIELLFYRCDVVSVGEVYLNNEHLSSTRYTLFLYIY